LVVFVAMERDRPGVLCRLRRRWRAAQLSQPLGPALPVLTRERLVQCPARFRHDGWEDALQSVVVGPVQVHHELRGHHGGVEQLLLVRPHVLDDVEDDVLAGGTFLGGHWCLARRYAARRREVRSSYGSSRSRARCSASQASLTRPTSISLRRPRSTRRSTAKAITAAPLARPICNHMT